MFFINKEININNISGFIPYLYPLCKAYVIACPSPPLRLIVLSPEESMTSRENLYIIIKEEIIAILFGKVGYLMENILLVILKANVKVHREHVFFL